MPGAGRLGRGAAHSMHPGTELSLVGHSAEWIFLIILYVTNNSTGKSLKTEWSEALGPKDPTLEHPFLG